MAEFDRPRLHHAVVHLTFVAHHLYVQVTVFNTRTAQQKKVLFQRIAQLLAESPGIRPEDVFLTIADAPKENWSVGHGLAQFA
ncbi:phenylpyruvate tautomerase PptA (4-oxalocrotonate tautomerase family) [Variovorax ginsengisoli]|uniref:Phenylpyruvate tautomerase PptA (4-oxalocrotonate tautomerase family) n=1 Tax=Variovorax ginsengisoli TaxID=363844 RepID=A0ABT9SFC4_9BURK|nr:tautomerase family protein [Variovorax ginsengisoli]MDP9902930.1 phenylpyruvate tautomerase PptA (4-oxalocrotonate tautomerase family) [Variovorax ginsengisoli]